MPAIGHLPKGGFTVVALQLRTVRNRPSSRRRAIAQRTAGFRKPRICAERPRLGESSQSAVCNEKQKAATLSSDGFKTAN